MPRKGENIYNRKDGRWEGRYIKCHKNNKAVYGYIYGRSYTEVRNKLKDAIIENERGSKTPTNVTLRQLSLLWFEYKRNVVKVSTLCRYRSILDVHIISSIGDTNIQDLTTEMMQNFVCTLLSKKLSGKTIVDILSVLKSVLAFAENNGYKHRCCLRYLNCKQNSKEMRVLTNAEQQSLTAYLLANPSLTNNAIIFALYTGIRIGELCALKYENFDFTNGILYINQTLQRIQIQDKFGAKTSILA